MSTSTIGINTVFENRVLNYYSQLGGMPPYHIGVICPHSIPTPGSQHERIPKYQLVDRKLKKLAVVYKSTLLHNAVGMLMDAGGSDCTSIAQYDRTEYYRVMMQT